MDIEIEPSTGDVHPRSGPTAHNQQSTLTALILTLQYTSNPSFRYYSASYVTHCVVHRVLVL
jgi:hypothetical protein